MSIPPEFFDDLYRREPDPWGFTERWYEHRKYALTLAALPRTTYSSALEIGASIGVFTKQLARRCDRVLGIDASDVALADARNRLAGNPTVTLERRTLPADWPPGSFDLIVFSEVGYWLSRDDLNRTVACIVSALEPGGDLVAVHWRPPGKVYELTGDVVHDVLRTQTGLHVLGSYVEDAFLLDVLRAT